MACKRLGTPCRICENVNNFNKIREIIQNACYFLFSTVLNASCFLLEHQWMFEPFLIVVFESINCPQCEKMDLKIIQSLLERVQICKNAGKLQNLQNVEDLSEEQCSVQLFRTNKGLMNNQHKTKEQSWIIQVTSHSIKNQGFPNFWRGLFE